MSSDLRTSSTAETEIINISRIVGRDNSSCVSACRFLYNGYPVRSFINVQWCSVFPGLFCNLPLCSAVFMASFTWSVDIPRSVSLCSLCFVRRKSALLGSCVPLMTSVTLIGPLRIKRETHSARFAIGSAARSRARFPHPRRVFPNGALGV
jgi:hypothetical protein